MKKNKKAKTLIADQAYVAGRLCGVWFGFNTWRGFEKAKNTLCVL